MVDMVNNPPHYQGSNGIETIDAIKAIMTPEEFVAHCRGTVVGYVSRAGKKGDPIEDMEKSIWYLNRAIETLEELKTVNSVHEKLVEAGIPLYGGDIPVIRELFCPEFTYVYDMQIDQWIEFKNDEPTGFTFETSLIVEGLTDDTQKWLEVVVD